MFLRLRSLFGAVLLALAMLPTGASADLFLSELCDPRLDYATDRFLEVYNPGPEAVDLSGWRLIAVANGVEVFTWELSGWIEPQQAMVAGDATTAVDFPVDFADEAWSGATGNWNGKVGDGARLVDPQGTVTDEVVAVATAFENADYVRRPEVEGPNPTYTPDEWTATPVDLPTEGSPGTHETSVTPQGPTIDGVQSDPLWPSAGDAVDILAEITDAGANIVGVLLRWGTSATSLPNSIAMEPVGGDSYRTLDPIPPQAGGATVYYRIEASNDLPATSVSELHSYALALELTISTIQGGVSSSPYDGLTVRTHGVVTAVYSSIFVLQDGPGPWNGIWARGEIVPAVGDSITVMGMVSESASAGELDCTTLVEAQVFESAPGATLPPPITLDSWLVALEAFEGVLVRVEDGVCLDVDPGSDEWLLDDGSGPCRVGSLGLAAAPTLGSTYRVTGPVAFRLGEFKIEPRDDLDVRWTADYGPPVLLGVFPLSDTALRLVFSEAVDPFSAGEIDNYGIPGLTVTAATREDERADHVRLGTSTMGAGDYTLTVTGVADIRGNVTDGTAFDFHYSSPGIPVGYYDDAEGLYGQALQEALHDIIKDHTARSYDYAWTAYFTTDVRPDNGKLWDVYSDIPGGTPPYLYTLGVDQGGTGGEEGTGYSREHSWPKSWFGGEVSPMYTDLFTLFPCDVHVNGMRGAYPYGETTTPQWVSLNGSELGPSSVPGYVGTVFEPIDDFKGDLARAHLYFSTRYWSEDAGWPGSPAVDGAELRPWTLALYLQWIEEDPVSQKEIDRNNAIYLIQGNRNPFVDRPDFVGMVYGSELTAVGDEFVPPRTSGGHRLEAVVPNPFNPRTEILFHLASPARVELAVYDARGRRVKELVAREYPAGDHRVRWSGEDGRGRPVASGIYHARMVVDGQTHQRSMTLVR